MDDTRTRDARSGRPRPELPESLAWLYDQPADEHPSGEDEPDPAPAPAPVPAVLAAPVPASADPEALPTLLPFSAPDDDDPDDDDEPAARSQGPDVFPLTASPTAYLAAPSPPPSPWAAPDARPAPASAAPPPLLPAAPEQQEPYELPALYDTPRFTRPSPQAVPAPPPPIPASSEAVPASPQAIPADLWPSTPASRHEPDDDWSRPAEPHDDRARPAAPDDVLAQPLGEVDGEPVNEFGTGTVNEVMGGSADETDDDWARPAGTEETFGAEETVGAEVAGPVTPPGPLPWRDLRSAATDTPDWMAPVARPFTPFGVPAPVDDGTSLFEPAVRPEVPDAGELVDLHEGEDEHEAGEQAHAYPFPALDGATLDEDTAQETGQDLREEADEDVHEEVPGAVHEDVRESVEEPFEESFGTPVAEPVEQSLEEPFEEPDEQPVAEPFEEPDEQPVEQGYVLLVQEGPAPEQFREPLPEEQFREPAEAPVRSLDGADVDPLDLVAVPQEPVVPPRPELADPALGPLWTAVREALQSSARHAEPTVDVRGLDQAGRRALAGLLGVPAVRAATRVDLAELEAVVTETGGMTLAAAAERFVPVSQGRRARTQTRTATLRAGQEWLEAHPAMAAQPWTGTWLETVRRDAVGADAGLTGHEVTSALAVLEALTAAPGQPSGRPAWRVRTELGAQVADDEHALDEGSAVAGLVLRGLAAAAGTSLPPDAAGRRRLWRRFGVLPDLVSSSSLAVGVAPADDALGRRWRLAALDGVPVHVTARDLRRTGAWVPVDEAWPAVLVVDSARVLDAIGERFGGRVPAVWADGVDDALALDLVARLFESGTAVRFVADFDQPGLALGSLLASRFGAAPWRMSAEVYRAAARSDLPPLTHRAADPDWAPELGTAMTQAGRALPVEQVLDELLAALELEVGRGGQPEAS